LKRFAYSIVLLYSIINSTFVNAQHNWTETAILELDTITAKKSFGSSVGIDGNFAIVGHYRNIEYLEDDTIFNAGAAYIYEKDIFGNWFFIQELFAINPSAYDSFGKNVAISGNQAIVSAHYDDEDASEQNFMSAAGAVYIFERQNNGYWAYKQKLVSSDRDTLDLFGYSLDLDSNQMIVSALWHDLDENGENFKEAAGAVYVYEIDFNGFWSQTQKLVASDRDTFDLFGANVSIFNDNMAINAHYNKNENFFNFPYHKDYLFRKENSWNEIYSFFGDETVSLQFSDDINNNNSAINDNYFFKGLFNFNALQGLVRIYKYDELANEWNFYEELLPDDIHNSDNFGYALDANNNSLFVSSLYEKSSVVDSFTTTSFRSNGAAYEFQFDEINQTWNHTNKFFASNRVDAMNVYPLSIQEKFGYDIDVSKNENAVIIGAPEKLVKSTFYFGSAYIYENLIPINLIENNPSKSITVFPNLTTDFIKIKFTQIYQDYSIEIYNSAGKLVGEKYILNDIYHTIDVKNYLSGLYYIKLKSKDEMPTILKFIKV